jgi:hypothetical protein
MPNFLVIGAAKCGTDSLCNYLGQHPDIFISPKREPNFFVAEGKDVIPYHGPGDTRALQDMWTSRLEDYRSLFSGVTRETAVGEGTAWYIYFEEAPIRIRHHIPDAKLIAILRNPVDRAYSAYTMLLRDGRETIRDFADALDAEDDRIRAGWEPIWYYVSMGYYARQIKNFYNYFDRDQMRFITYDHFNLHPHAVLRELFEFLGVDRDFKSDTSKRTNVSLVPRNHQLHAAVVGDYSIKSAVKKVVPQSLRGPLKERILRRNLTQPTPLNPEIRARLMRAFREDIRETQELLRWDLSHWLA